MFPRPILNNKPVSKQTRGNDYAASKFTESPEEPKEDIMAADKQIAAIVAQVTVAMRRARVESGATTKYVHNPYEVDINSGTPYGLKLYLKAIKAKENYEYRLNISQSNSKEVVICMKDLTANFGWYVIMSKIDNTKDPRTNLVNIFTSMNLIKLDHIKKQADHYWGPANGNDFPDVLSV